MNMNDDVLKLYLEKLDEAIRESNRTHDIQIETLRGLVLTLQAQDMKLDALIKKNDEVDEWRDKMYRGTMGLIVVLLANIFVMLVTKFM